MKRPRRTLRIIGMVALGLLAIAFVIGIKVRLGVGPKLETPPLLSAEPTAAVLLIRDVAVFSGNDTQLKPHQDVIVRGGRIEKVAPTGAAPPDGAQVLDGAGRTLLPGFIDAHTHISGAGAPRWAPCRVSDQHNLEAYVYSGVTTAYVLGGIARDLAGLRAQVDQGKAIGPQLYYTHLPITTPGGHPLRIGKEIVPWPVPQLAAALLPQPKDVEEAARVVEKTAAEHVHFVKVIRDSLPPSAPAMPEAVLQAIVRASHARGLKVFAHIGTIDDALVAARAGVDVLAHGIYRGPVSAEQAQELAQRHVPVIFTLAGWVRTATMARGQLVPTELDRATVPASILESVAGDAGRQLSGTPAFAEFVAALLENEPLWQKNVRALVAAGVPLLVGTDSPLPGIFPGSSYHAELRLLADFGVPNGDLLLGATSRAADVLSLDSGRIEAGKLADLILVQGDPLQDLSATSRIEAIVLRGRVVRRIAK